MISRTDKISYTSAETIKFLSTVKEAGVVLTPQNGGAVAIITTSPSGKTSTVNLSYNTSTGYSEGSILVTSAMTVALKAERSGGVLLCRKTAWRY